MKLYTMLGDLANAPAAARQLEEIGLDGVFTFEGPHDVFTPLVLASTSTSRIDLMTNVAIAFPRNPIQLAHQAYDLQVLSEGRFVLGLGTQIRTQIEKRYGAEFEKPVARMREMIAALRAIYDCWQNGERLDFRGDFYRHTLMTPMFNPGPNPYGCPPIFVGALGPQMTRMVAGHADGLLVMPFNSAKHFEERTLPEVDEGLLRSGRTRNDLTIFAEVIVSCGRDQAEQEMADAGTRWLLSFYASTPAYRPVLEVSGWEDLQPELNARAKSGAWDEMPAMIDDTMLSTLAVRGSPREVALQVTERFQERADRIGFYCPYRISPEILGQLVDEFRAVDQEGNSGTL